MIRVCVECQNEFDTTSKEKRRIGGMITHCPDCSEETVTRYAGVQNSDGKQAGVTVLKFNNESDRAAYLEFWKVNSGMYKGKSCQIGRGIKNTPNIQFSTKAVFEGNMNHKGKA